MNSNNLTEIKYHFSFYGKTLKGLISEQLKFTGQC
jgi:hypothetical protein